MSSTTDRDGAIRTRLLTFNPIDADVPLGSALLVGGLHKQAPPDNAAYPYGVLRVTGAGLGRDDADMSREGTIELFLVGRPRAMLPVLEQIADIAEQAMWKWQTDTTGWLAVRELMSRVTMPPFPSPANAEMQQIRLVWRYTWWPTHLMQYSGVTPS